MPTRFHRSIKIIPGVRLNLSKSGLGASFGPRGMKYSIGPKGTRKTASLLGTGLSFIDQNGNSQKNSNSEDQMDAAVPDPETSGRNKRNCLWIALILLAIPIIVFGCILGSDGGNQNPTPTPSQSSSFLIDSSTPTTIAVQTKTPTSAVAGENTPSPTGTNNSSSTCNCSEDYNCSDFLSHDAAQACFSACGGSSSYNWANLDGTDSDGLVCETLP